MQSLQLPLSKCRHSLFLSVELALSLFFHIQHHLMLMPNSDPWHIITQISQARPDPCLNPSVRTLNLWHDKGGSPTSSPPDPDPQQRNHREGGAPWPAAGPGPSPQHHHHHLLHHHHRRRCSCCRADDMRPCLKPRQPGSGCRQAPHGSVTRHWAPLWRWVAFMTGVHKRVSAHILPAMFRADRAFCSQRGGWWWWSRWYELNIPETSIDNTHICRVMEWGIAEGMWDMYGWRNKSLTGKGVLMGKS